MLASHIFPKHTKDGKTELDIYAERAYMSIFYKVCGGTEGDSGLRDERWKRSGLRVEVEGEIR